METPITNKPFGDGLYQPIHSDFGDGLPHGSVFGGVSQGQLCCPRKRARTAEAKVRVLWFYCLVGMVLRRDWNSGSWSLISGVPKMWVTPKWRVENGKSW